MLASVDRMVDALSDGTDAAPDLARWIDKLYDMVERHQDSLQVVSTREKVSARVGHALRSIHEALADATFDAAAAAKVLATCKVLMRDRRGIDVLLTLEAFERFLSLAEVPPASPSDWSASEEALKCAINSVYSRPEFVSQHFVAQSHLQRLLALAKRPGPASFHLLVWKCVLVSCEAPIAIEALCGSLEAWELLHATLFFSFHGGSLAGITTTPDRSALVLDLLKLLAVLVNEMQWTKDAEAAEPAVFAVVHRLGELLLSMLRASHPAVSPLHAVLVDIKNKVLEVFMFIPAWLLTAFINSQEQQHLCDSVDQDEDAPALVALVEHLRSMLLVTRVEKARHVSEVLPTLIVCHNLTQVAPPHMKAFFQRRVLSSLAPPASAAATSSEASALHDADARETQYFFKHLTFFLTCLDTNVKRYAGEWLYQLCDQNADEYTRRTGLGNAIGMLRIKGLA